MVEMDMVITAPLTGSGAYTGHPTKVANQSARNGVVTGIDSNGQVSNFGQIAVPGSPKKKQKNNRRAC